MAPVSRIRPPNANLKRMLSRLSNAKRRAYAAAKQVAIETRPGPRNRATEQLRKAVSDFRRVYARLPASSRTKNQLDYGRMFILYLNPESRLGRPET